MSSRPSTISGRDEVTEHYVTLFDASFLPQGIALHRSMERHAGDFHLWIIAIDEPASSALRALDLPNVTVLDLLDIETSELLSVKPLRTRGEYCWTLTPFTPTVVFEADPAVQRVTYVDSDLWFTASPDAVFEEFDRSGRAVMITDHAYAPEHDQALASGRFCVQFMPFVRDSSQSVLTWWQERCIEWCYARFEDGKFGDQKYLDDWPSRFPDQVHVFEQISTMQAPWNANRFDPRDAIVFHFHELRTRDRQHVRLGHYRLPERTLRQIYDPYLVDLATALSSLRSIGVTAPPQKPPKGAWQEFKDRMALRVLDRTPPRSPLTARLPRLPS